MQRLFLFILKEFIWPLRFFLLLSSPRYQGPAAVLSCSPTSVLLPSPHIPLQFLCTPCTFPPRQDYLWYSACMSSLIAMLMDYCSLIPREKIGEFISSVTSLAVVETWIISTFCIFFSSKIWSKMYEVLRKKTANFNLTNCSFPYWQKCSEPHHILQSFEGQEIVQRKHHNYAGVAIL